MQNLNKIIIISSTFILIISVLVFSVYYYVSNSSLNNFQENKINKTGYQKSKEDEEFLVLEEKFKKNNSMDVFRSFDALSTKEEDLSKQVVIKLYAGASLLELDKNAASDYYMQIANNESYKPISRAYAMIKIAQKSSADIDPELLKVFFPEGFDIKNKTMTELLYLVHKKIYEIHPYGISAARIARYELKQNPSTTTAQTLYDTYKNPIEKNIREMLPYPDLNHLVPNTLLNTAIFYEDLLKYGITNEELVVNTFEDAYETSNKYSSVETREFILIRYAEHYARVDNTERVNIILELLKKVQRSKTFANYLKNNASKTENFALYNLSKKNEQVKIFFQEYNW